MPGHAKILTVLLVVNFLLGLVPFVWGISGSDVVGAVVRAFLIGGFLLGSEGVRMILMWGAFVSIALGGFTVLVALPLLGSAGAMGMLVFATGAYSIVVGAYMLWALRSEEVQRWMLARSLGDDLAN